MDGKFYESRQYPDLEILDRVGGGDSFASGLIYGLMTTGDAAEGRGLRRRPRRAGHDHARRHLHGVAKEVEASSKAAARGCSAKA